MSAQENAELLFEENQLLAKYFTKRFGSILRDVRGFDEDDILQEARIALWEACTQYDPSRGKLSTLAGVRIKTNYQHARDYESRYKRRAHNTARSFEAPVVADDDLSLADLLPAEDDPERDVFTLQLAEKTRKRVSVKTKKIFDLLLLGYTPLEIASQMKMSKQAIHQHRQKIQNAYLKAAR